MHFSLVTLLVLTGVSQAQVSTLVNHSISSAQQVSLNCGELNVMTIKASGGKNYKFDSKDTCKNMLLLLKLADSSCPISVRTGADGFVDSAELSCDIDQQRAKKGVKGL